MQDDTSHNLALLEALNKRLKVLELQSAKYGVDSPAHIIVEIDDIKKQIKVLEKDTQVFHPALSISNDNDLQLVDIAFIDFAYAMLDVKIRNIGNKTAFLTKANFAFERNWLFVPRSFIALPHEYISLSYKYSVNVPLQTTPFSLSVPISQSIKPNEVDRFAFILYSEITDKRIIHVLLADIELEYNKDKRLLSSRKFLFSIPDELTKLQQLSDYKNDQIYDQYLREINDISAIRSNLLREFMAISQKDH